MTLGVEWLVECGNWRSHTGQSSAARQLLCRLLGANLDVEHNTLGAPCLPERPDLHISLSHCRTAVAVAVSNSGPVGIDIESRRRISDSLMQHVCTPSELETIHASDDPTMAFLRLWTRKEAVLKCRGTGIKGFGSMVHALEAPDIMVQDLACEIPDTVAALATVV